MNETKQFKAKLKAEVTEQVYNDVIRVAQHVLKTLPKDVPLGTLTAGLLLAGIAHSESAPFAKALIQDQM
jgi:hypothetical protein